MASNVADQYLYFTSPATAGYPGSAAAITDYDMDLTGTGVFGVYPLFSRVQVKECGFIVTVAFTANTVDPIVKLQQLSGTDFGTTTDLITITLGSSNTKLRKYTTNPDAVAAGGPGTVVVGPSIGGHTSALSADSGLTAGTIIICDTKSLPTAVLEAGTLLQMNCTTAATVGTAHVVGFVRLEFAPEQYTTAYVNYDAIP